MAIIRLRREVVRIEVERCVILLCEVEGGSFRLGVAKVTWLFPFGHIGVTDKGIGRVPFQGDRGGWLSLWRLIFAPLVIRWARKLAQSLLKPSGSGHSIVCNLRLNHHIKCSLFPGYTMCPVYIRLGANLLRLQTRAKFSIFRFRRKKIAHRALTIRCGRYLSDAVPISIGYRSARNF